MEKWTSFNFAIIWKNYEEYDLVASISAVLKLSPIWVLSKVHSCLTTMIDKELGLSELIDCKYLSFILNEKNNPCNS